MIIFEKTYDGESIVDIEQDIYESINENYDLPMDENNFNTGTFKVTIEWFND